MLIFTNRQSAAGNEDGAAFKSRFTVNAPRLSVARARPLSSDDGSADWATDEIAVEASDEDILDRLHTYIAAARGRGDKILVYVHGNGYDYRECLTRCDAMANAFANTALIGFSWPSEGFTPGRASTITETDRAMAHADGAKDRLAFLHWLKATQARYRQAKKNAEATAVAFTRFLQLLNHALIGAGDARLATLAIHSLGNHLLWKAVRTEHADAFLTGFSNIVLLAPCLATSLHVEVLAALNPASVYVTFNKNDWVLAGAQIADHEQKLGLDPGSELSANPHARYIAFDGAARGAIGHRYFLDPDDLRVASTRTLFEKLFSGDDDFAPTEDPRATYPFGCDAQRRVCWMGVSTTIDASSPGG